MSYSKPSYLVVEFWVGLVDFIACKMATIKQNRIESLLVALYCIIPCKVAPSCSCCSGFGVDFLAWKLSDHKT